MSFLSSLNISASGLTAQRLRLDVVANNIANIDTTRTEDGTPYRRKMTVLEEKQDFGTVLNRSMNQMNAGNSGGVVATEIVDDETELNAVYDPTHPDANEEGYVMYPNIDMVKETTDAMSASRSYEANINSFNTMKQMAQKALEIGR